MHISLAFCFDLVRTKWTETDPDWQADSNPSFGLLRIWVATFGFLRIRIIEFSINGVKLHFFQFWDLGRGGDMGWIMATKGRIIDQIVGGVNGGVDFVNRA